jgi:hypothetical protein
METVGCHKETGGVGFEPTTTSLGESHIDWDAFFDWLKANHREDVSKNMLSYAKRYGSFIFNGNFKQLCSLPQTIRPNVIKSLSALSKFLGRHEEFKRLMKAYGLSWRGKSADELVIERFSKVVNPNEIWEWIRQVKAVRPELSDFLDFMAVSGLRCNEAIESYNLIIKLSKSGKLSEYYDSDREVLEHYKFKDLFLRKSKKAFASFVPKDLVQRIARNYETLTRFAVQKRIQKAGLKIRLTDIREAHASTLTKYLSQPEIDFLHGRVSANVFMANYFNPKLIADLKERIFKAIADIQAKI